MRSGSAYGAAAAALLVAAGCGGGGDGLGPSGRTVVTGLALGGAPGPLALVDAFPQLGFEAPVLFTHPPDGSDRAVVVEQGGRVWIFPNDPATSSATLLLDLGPELEAGGERGLLGLAFHPDFAANGLFYVYYSAPATTPGDDHRSVLARYAISAGDPDVADPASATVLLEIPQPFANHNAGMLAFGPDGMLYVAVGDGGSGGDPGDVAQDLSSLLGKLLRLDPDGNPAPGNPFAGTPGARPEVWAFGLRNPWRFSFDRATGELWLGDVGQNQWEEIDLVTAGADLGWDTFEGTHDYENPGGVPLAATVAPVIEYDHSQGASVTGGYVYRGTQNPGLVGAYVYGDFTSGRVWALVRDGDQVLSNEQVATVANPASFGEDQAGELYVCSFDGRIYRFEESGAGGGEPPQWLSQTGIFSDTANLVPTPGLLEYDVNAPLWSDGAAKRRWLALPGLEQIDFDPTEAWSFPLGTVLVKHFELEVAPGELRRLETRALVHSAAGWSGWTWRWNEAQDDAQLVAGAQTATIPVLGPDGPEERTWTFPSSADCARCHTAAAGSVLGARTRQVNRAFGGPAPAGNQLAAWDQLGLFTSGVGDPAALEALAVPDDPSAPLADRARAYLAANCAHCHRPGGPTGVALDLRYGIPSSALNAVGVPATAGDLGLEGGLLIDPWSRATSVLWERLRRLDDTRMPPLGSHLVDEAAVELVGQWIDAGAP